MQPLWYILIMDFIKIVTYRTKSGKRPYREWFESLDTAMQTIIDKRLDRVKLGNFGVHKPIKGSKKLKELIFDVGPGYRIYYVMHGKTMVILLAAGDKSTQDRDIAKAEQYWDECREELTDE